MKHDHFQSAPPHRPALRAVVVFVAGVSGGLGLNFGLDAYDTWLVVDASAPPTFHESVFPGGRRPSAVPDHALLSATDVERALPVPPRVPRSTVTPAS
jgi:hypothetical protein